MISFWGLFAIGLLPLAALFAYYGLESLLNRADRIGWARTIRGILINLLLALGLLAWILLWVYLAVRSRFPPG